MSLEDMLKEHRDILERQTLFGCKPMPLTKNERFIIAYFGGVKTYWVYEGTKASVTTEPCGIGWDGRRFIVIVKGAA